MSKNTKIVSAISVASMLMIAITLALGLSWSPAAEAADQEHGHQASHVSHLSHITTRAEAEALKPGDAIAMACSKCKHVMLHHVTQDQSHLKLLTIGEKHKCVCDGIVTVVGTGKGNGKHEDVNLVCSNCGDDAMFICATKPGSGAKHEHSQHAK